MKQKEKNKIMAYFYHHQDTIKGKKKRRGKVCATQGVQLHQKIKQVNSLFCLIIP